MKDCVYGKCKRLWLRFSFVRSTLRKPTVEQHSNSSATPKSPTDVSACYLGLGLSEVVEMVAILQRRLNMYAGFLRAWGLMLGIFYYQQLCKTPDCTKSNFNRILKLFWRKRCHCNLQIYLRLGPICSKSCMYSDPRSDAHWWSRTGNGLFWLVKNNRTVSSMAIFQIHDKMNKSNSCSCCQYVALRHKYSEPHPVQDIEHLTLLYCYYVAPHTSQHEFQSDGPVFPTIMRLRLDIMGQTSSRLRIC